MIKHCPDCGQMRERSEFNNNRTRGDGLQAICRLCQQERKWLARYGITREEYNEMLTRQNHACAICGITADAYAKEHAAFDRFSVDHCHDTHQVRGLLCNNCNAAIGLLKHDTSRLAAAISFLEGVMR